MQSHYPAAFEREAGCTEAEWLDQLPGAVNGQGFVLAPNAARVRIGEGVLMLAWNVLPPRQIALMRMPRMAVSFRFEGVADDARHRFMRYFDMYMQRGGG